MMVGVLYLALAPLQLTLYSLTDKLRHAAVANKRANLLPNFLGKPDKRRFVA